MQPLHLVWIDGTYDMVRFQELAEYGRIFAFLELLFEMLTRTIL